MSNHTTSVRSATGFLTFIIKDSDGNIAHRIRYSNLNVTRHSGLLRSHIFDHGRITFDLTDLREHKYPLHDPEVFAQVIHWLAENCKAPSLSWARKQLQWDEKEETLMWRGWRKGYAEEKPGFERKIPWAPFECKFKIGTEHAIGFDKALWMYMYMLQLKLDNTLEPLMVELREGLFQWLDENVPETCQVEALWLRFGKGKRDEALSTAAIRRLVDARDAGELGAEECEKGDMFLSCLPMSLKKSVRPRHDSMTD
jgi:hypothetical protein